MVNYLYLLELQRRRSKVLIMSIRDSSADKAIFITGASSGIGLATAKFFLDQGWRVVATMRDTSDAPPWMNNGRVLIARVDVTAMDSLEAGVARAEEAFGKIDVMFANAGYGLNGPLEGATEEQMHRQFDVNVFGVARTIKAVAPHMRQHGSGIIIVTSSIGGLIGMPVSPYYIATKHAVEGMIESARFELKPFGIRLKLIEPGGIRTDFSVRSAAWTEHPAYSEVIESAKRMALSLLENAPDPSEVAKTVFTAAKDNSERLRYHAMPGPYVMLYKLLPDRLWRAIIEAALRSAAKQKQTSYTRVTGARA